ncbi:tyrosine recombinase XerC [Nocardia fluminea]|uniref:site-specific integrase n=1 Tax=Nocardia fluminea TaxID=134984 RepID=UPI0036700390
MLADDALRIRGSPARPPACPAAPLPSTLRAVARRVVGLPGCRRHTNEETMTGRRPRPVGTFATPSKPKKQRNGSWKATVRFYGVWGTPQITRFGATSGEASDRLAEAMRDFREVPRNSQITRSTTLTMLAQELLAEMRADTACSAGLVEDYRREIEVSTHRLANPKTIKIDNSIGRLQIWQATAGELDRHIKQLTTLGFRRKAKQHKIILRAMMQIAVRHGALDANPIDGVAAFRRVAKPARGKMADMESLPAFRDQVRAWARGEEVPGTPAYISGPKRDWTMVWVVDVITGTGIRPYEVFALLLDEINLDAPVPYFDVTGTLVEVKGADNGGWVRKPTPKTENGWRRILLPQHTIEAIGEAIIDLEITRCPNPMGLLFPARNGSLRNPNNFGRIWRAARGENFAWVTPRTFRRGVATAVDHASESPERAARQLGNTTAVAKAHYIDRPDTAPDNREILEQWAKGGPQEPRQSPLETP